MNDFAAGTRSFAVAAAVTALVGGLGVWATGPLAAGEDADSVSPVLRQVEGQAAETGTAESGTPDPGAVEATAAAPAGADEGPSTVDELVDQLEADGLTETFEVYLSRDPFQPVVVQATTDGESSDGGDATGDTSGTDTGGTTGGSGSGSATACSGSGEEAVCEGVVVTMTGFDDDGDALIEVDGTLYVVSEGMEFATSFRVERLDRSSGCAFLRYGDEAFTICTGATGLK